MRQDLSAEQWYVVEDGEFLAPDGRTYRRRTTRMKRKEAAALVEAGSPLVTYWPGGLPGRTELIWFDQNDARAEWERVRAAVTSDPPQLRRGRSTATVGRWESLDAAAVIVLTWHH